MVKKVSGKDRVEAALQATADALKKGEKAYKKFETPRTLRSSSRQNSNANSASTSRNQSPAKPITSRNQSPEATLAVPPSRKAKASVVIKGEGENPALTTREKADHDRDAALAGGDKPARDKLAREKAAKDKYVEARAAKAKAKDKAAEVKATAAKAKAVKALEKAAERKAAKAREKAAAATAAKKAAESDGVTQDADDDGTHLSDVSEDGDTSDDHASDASFQGSDKATASRKRRLDAGHEDGSDSESEGELLPKTKKKTVVARGKDLPTRRQNVPVPKRSTTPQQSISRSNSVPSSGSGRGQPPPLPPASPAYVQVGEADLARDAGEKATLFAAVREAYADIGPHLPPRPPFIYWDPEKVYSCANKVIARTPLLQEMSQKYNRRNDFAKKHGQAVRTHANNERSAQIRTMKAMWLNNESYISLVYYDESITPVNIALSDDLKSLGSIEDLRKILFSDALYTFPVLYNFICLGLESGNFKATSACGLSTISNLITPAHEAHFWVELWYALPYHGCRHSISTSHAKERMAKWTEFLPLVLKDRKENEVAAHDTRKLRSMTGVPADEQEDDDINDDEAGSEYW